MQAGGKYPLNVCKRFIAWKTLPDQRWADTLCPRIPQGGSCWKLFSKGWYVNSQHSVMMLQANTRITFEMCTFMRTPLSLCRCTQTRDNYPAGVISQTEIRVNTCPVSSLRCHCQTGGCGVWDDQGQRRLNWEQG